MALGLIICSAIFGFQLGLFFSVLMVGFAMAAILYDTSQIMTQFSKDQYVAASLSLFAHRFLSGILGIWEMEVMDPAERPSPGASHPLMHRCRSGIRGIRRKYQNANDKTSLVAR